MFGPQNRTRQILSKRRKAQIARARRRLSVQTLEDRALMDVHLGNLIAVDMLQGKDQYISLQATDDGGNPITYTANPSAGVTTQILTGNAINGRSVRFTVSGVDDTNTAFVGTLEFRLFEDIAPQAAQRIIDLINLGYYNGKLFDTVVDNSTASWGSGSSGTANLSDEFESHTAFVSPGLLGMANTGSDDTNNTQLFVVDTDIPLGSMPQEMNFQNSIIGVLTKGQDVLAKIMSTPTSGGVPASDVTIMNSSVFVDTENAVLKVSAPSFAGTPTIDVTATSLAGADTKSVTFGVSADTLNDRAFLGNVTVAGQINNQPINTITSITTNEDQAITITITGIDQETDPLDFVVRDAANFANSPANLTSQITVTPASGGNPATATIVLTPNANFSGTVNLKFGVRDQTPRALDGSNVLLPLDAEGNYDTQTIALSIASVNDKPAVNAQTVSTNINTPKNITLTGNDGGTGESQTLTYEILANPGHGTISNFNASAGTFTYTPLAGFTGQDTVTVRVKDNGGTANGGADTSDPVLVKINVVDPALSGDVHLNPLSVIDMEQGKDQYIPLQATDDNGNPITYSVTTSNPLVTTQILTGNSVNGRSIRFTVSGTDANNQPFTGTLEFRLFEDIAPLAVAQIVSLINTGFYNNIIFHRVIDNFIAQWGDPNGNGTGGSPLPDFGDEFNKSTVFTSRGLLAMANSGDDTNDSQLFVVDTDISLAQMPEHLDFQHTIFGVLTRGQDVLQKIMTAPTSGNAGNPANKPTNNITITSAAVFTDTANAVLKVSAPTTVTGAVTLNVTATNGQAGADNSETKSAVVNVAADTKNERPFIGTINNQPVNSVTTVTTNEDQSVTITVTGVDLENDALNFVVRDATNFANAPANMTSQITVTPASGSTPATATIVLTPAANFSGNISFVIGVRDQTARATNSSNALLPIDDQGNFDTQRLTLSVTNSNDKPIANSQTKNTALNTPVNVTLTGDDGDPGVTQVLTWEIVTQPTHGSVSNFNAAAGTFTYTPNTGFSGQDTIVVRVKDDGGTANGGQDTSNNATVTINVDAPNAPTNLDLTAASDNGLYNDDNFTSVERPVITAQGAAGATMKLFVNGSSTGIAMTESSPGNFTVTLPQGTLKVGENTFVAKAAKNGAESPESDELSILFAPDLGGVYRVPGDVGEASTVNAGLVKKLAKFNSEVGYFKVDDASGRINGAAPGTKAWLLAAFNSDSKVVLHDPSATAGDTAEINVNGGDFIVFYIVVKGTSATFLANNPENGQNDPHAFFSLAAANPDHARHVNMVGDPTTGDAVLGFEDLWGGGDRDFNDVVLALSTSINPAAEIAEYLRTPAGEGHQVKLHAKLEEGGKQNGDGLKGVAGEFGVFQVDDELGRVNGMFPGDDGYLAAALAAGNKFVLFTGGQQIGANSTVTLEGGKLLGFYYIPGGTAASLLANNATNDKTKSPVGFMSFDSGNSDDKEHFRWFGAESVESIDGSNNGDSPVTEMHVMGKLNGTDVDFDDFKVAVSFSK